MDFSRSLVRVAGAGPPKGRSFDGIDILQAMEANQPVQKRTLFWRARRGERTRKAVRDGSLKYICLHEGNDMKEYLFDLERDPAEKNNLLSEQKKSLIRLKTLLRDWEEQVRHKR
jgi:N-acetylgalactosamine-6-sulfatase